MNGRVGPLYLEWEAAALEGNERVPGEGMAGGSSMPRVIGECEVVGELQAMELVEDACSAAVDDLRIRRLIVLPQLPITRSYWAVDTLDGGLS